MKPTGELSSFSQAKEWLSIRALAELLGIPIPPKGKFRNPFRHDKHPSCTISSDGKHLKDWSNGDKAYDIGDFYRLATGCGADKAPIELVKFLESNGKIVPCRTFHYPDLPTTKPAKPRMADPLADDLFCHLPSLADCRTLAKLRGLSAIPFDLAARYGCLYIAEVCGELSWILTDKAAYAFEARRLDGKPYAASGNLAARKTHTLRGSDKTWLVGLRTSQLPINACPKVVIAEGSAAYFELLELLVNYGESDWQPAVLLGCQVRDIHPKAVEILRRKQVIRIVPDHDEPGHAAAQAWSVLLKDLGNKLEVKKWPPDWPYKDLGDALKGLSETQKYQLAKELFT